jgi:hypothetical protein
MAVSFLGSLRVRFLSATVVVCLLSLSWLQAASEQPQEFISQQPLSNPIRGQKQFWKQPRPPDATPDVIHSLLSGITGIGGRRGLRARHGTARLRKTVSMGKQWLQLHKYAPCACTFFVDPHHRAKPHNMLEGNSLGTDCFMWCKEHAANASSWCLATMIQIK